jgi:hypothetical protein
LRFPGFLPRAAFLCAGPPDVALPVGHGLDAAFAYVHAVEPFLKTDRLSDSERAMLMGGACAKAYGWSPKRV